MTPENFEKILARSVEILTDNLRDSDLYHDPVRFQQHVRDTIRLAAHGLGVEVAPSFHPHEEYWGEPCPPHERIHEWLRRADGFATEWCPSDELFIG